MHSHPAALLAEPAILFCYGRLDLSFFLFSPPNLRASKVAGRSSPKLCHMFDDDPYYKIPPDFVDPPSATLRPKNIIISVRFRKTSQPYREYPRNEARHRQIENSVANCDHSGTCACCLICRNLVNKRRKMAPEFQLTQRGVVLSTVAYPGLDVGWAQRVWGRKSPNEFYE